jgi:hypothetical protein
METFFENVYENNEWGNNNNQYYKGSSGGGSGLNYNIDTYIPFLQNFIKDNKIKTIVDLGCGDFVCGKNIYDTLDDISYTGYDIYIKIIEYNLKLFTLPKYNFIYSDFYNNKETLKNADLCILKDVLQHWKIEEIYNFMDYIIESKKFKYILIINCCNQKSNDFNNENRSSPLSIDYLPLKKYNPVKLYNYNTKEVSLIKN